VRAADQARDHSDDLKRFYTGLKMAAVARGTKMKDLLEEMFAHYRQTKPHQGE
jgi:hypothetical protein